MNDKLKKMQIIEVELLDEFVRICKKHNLKYYLMFGSLLGAVRHKGFIPWDEDMDVALFRADYNRFREVVLEELKEGYFFHDYITDKNNPSSIVRIRKDGTVFASDKALKLGMTHNGFWIDIFPIDNVDCENSFIFKLQRILNKPLRRLIFHRALKDCTGLSYSWLRRILHSVSCILPLRIWQNIREIVFQLNKNDNSEYCVIFSATYPCNTLVPKKVYGEPVKVEFEGKFYNAPQDWDLLLTQIYGDYMTPPPEEKRKICYEPTIWEV